MIMRQKASGALSCADVDTSARLDWIMTIEECVFLYFCSVLDYCIWNGRALCVYDASGTH